MGTKTENERRVFGRRERSANGFIDRGANFDDGKRSIFPLFAANGTGRVDDANFTGRVERSGRENFADKKEEKGKVRETVGDGFSLTSFYRPKRVVSIAENGKTLRNFPFYNGRIESAA